MGYIYIMENPIFNNYIKIGYADNVKARLNTLNTAVPEPYHVYAIYKTNARLTDKSFHKVIDSINPSIRYDSHREFYEMTAEHAYQILLSISKINGLEQNLVLNPYNDEYFIKRIENITSYGRPKVPGRISFADLNIPIGSKLSFNIDSKITVITADDKNHVIYNGITYTISKAATILRKNLGYPYKSINGWIEFSYNNTSLGDLRNQFWANKCWSK